MLLQLRWKGLESQPIVFADHLVVSARGDYFLLSVGQVADPQLLPDDTEGAEELRARGTVEINPVARIAVPRTKMIEFLTGASELLARLQIEPSEEDLSK